MPGAGALSSIALPKIDTLGGAAVIAFGVDTISKIAISASLPLHGAVQLDPWGWIILRHEENCAGGGGLPRFPTFVYLGALVFMTLYLRTVGDDTAAGLMLGGAVGNILGLMVVVTTAGVVLPDSLLAQPPGCVTDWIQLGAPVLGDTLGTGAPVFNFADWCLITGALMFSRLRITQSVGVAFAAAPVALVVMGTILHLIRQLFFHH